MADKVNKEAEALIPTDWGTFRMIAYQSDKSDYTPDLALVHPDCNMESAVDIRIHSECITGDLFHSQKCDCGPQLHAAMEHINEFKGVLIYLRQEGRGIGLINKLKAYNKQAEGLDTVEANKALGFKNDYRQYQKAKDILMDLGITKINLLTNNPEKIEAFNDANITLVKRVPLEIVANENNRGYLQTKKEILGHLINIETKN